MEINFYKARFFYKNYSYNIFNSKFSLKHKIYFFNHSKKKLFDSKPAQSVFYLHSASSNFDNS
jgi:hypothetical protein